MKKKYKSLVKDTLIFALGSVGSKCILFFLVPIYTNYLTTREFGTSDLVFTVAQLIMPFFSLVIYDAVIRFGLTKNQPSENVLLVGFLITGIGGIFTLLFTPLFGLYSPIAEWKWYLSIYIILSNFLSVEMNYLKVKDKNKIYALISIAQTAVMAGLNVLLLVVFHIGIKGYLLAYIIASGCAVVLATGAANIMADLKKAVFDRKLLSEMVKFSAPLILNNISWWVVQSSDKMMVEFFLGASALGIYTVASKIPSLINVMINVFSQAWGISSVKEIESSNDVSFYSSVLKTYILLAFGACVCLVSIIKPFMLLYVGKAFSDAWQYVPLLLTAAAFASIAYYYGSLYGALKKSWNNMLTTLTAAIVNIIINYILLKYIGLWGAILGTLISYIVMAHSRMINVGKYIPIKINKIQYSANCIIMTTQAVLVSLDWHVYLVSLFAMILFVAVNRKEIRFLFKRK